MPKLLETTDGRILTKLKPAEFAKWAGISVRTAYEWAKRRHPAARWNEFDGWYFIWQDYSNYSDSSKPKPHAKTEGENGNTKKGRQKEHINKLRAV